MPRILIADDEDAIRALLKEFLEAEGFEVAEATDGQQVEAPQERLGDVDPNERIVGNTPAMQEVYKTIGRVARSDISVLITGETGTGKELVATAIHKNSTYGRGPFVTVNCAALPETL